MYTLGINAAFHDPAACLVQNGRLIAAAEEERFTHIKHGKRPIPFSTYELPFHAIEFCVRKAGIRLSDVDHVAYSFDPYLLLGPHAGNAQIPIPLQRQGLETREWESPWDPLALSAIVNAPRHLASGVPHHLSELRRPSGGGTRQLALCAASSGSCRERIPRLSVSLGRRHDAGRAGRARHDELPCGARTAAHRAWRGHHAALARPLVRTGHHLSGLFAFQRRV